MAAHAQASTKTLADKCTKGDAEACANLGAAVFDKNKENGAEYFRHACDFGKESLCVFYDAAHPRPVKKTAPILAPTAPDAQLVAWINGNVPDLLLALYPVRGAGNADHFSLDQCRIPDMKLVQLVMKLIKVYRHRFNFKKGCDAEGMLDLQLDEPYSLDLKLKDFGGVERIVGKVTTTVKMTPQTSEVVQKTVIAEGVAYDAKGSVFARFELAHDRTIAMQLLQARVTTLENMGHVKVSEFRGKPLQYEQSFALDHIDR